MSRGYSRVILVGNLGRDPELQYLPSGDPVAKFPLAVNRQRRGQNGEQVQETDWYQISCFRRNAEVADEYLKQGAQVLVDGQIQIRQYTTQDGKERTSVDVRCDTFQMMGSRDGGNSGGQSRESDPF